MTKFKYFLLIFTLLIGFGVRLYKIDSPIADWHSFRQADTASVTRHFIQNGIDLLHPTYHDLSNTQSGLDNPQGFRFVEFPIYNFISAIIFKYLNFFSFSPEIISRLVSIIFSLGSAVLIFLICYQLIHLFPPSYWALVIFLFLPFNIFYSRSILPEPTAVFFMLLSLYLFKKSLILSGLFLAIAMLLKPYTALIISPVLFLEIINHRLLYFKLKPLLKLFLFSLISLLPFILWRLWITQYPEGIPVNQWLLAKNINYSGLDWFKGIQVSRFLSLIIFHPYWYRWLFFERVANLILGSFGLIPLFLGFLYQKNYSQRFCLSLLLGIIFYFMVVAGGNIQHDYYQVLIVPFIAVISGFGYYFLTRFTFSQFWSYLSLFIILTFSIVFSGYQVIEFYKINNPVIISAGQKADTILPKNALIVAPYQGDTALLYQTNRRGWPTEIYDFSFITSQHQSNPLYLVSVNFDQYTNFVLSKYPSVYRNDQFVIIDLNQTLPNENN